MFIFFVVHLEMLFLIYLTIAFFVIQFWEELLTKWNEEKNDISWMKETKKSITSPYSLFCIYISSSIVKLILHQIINFLRKTVLQCTVQYLYYSNSIESSEAAVQEYCWACWYYPRYYREPTKYTRQNSSTQKGSCCSSAHWCCKKSYTDPFSLHSQ